MANTHRHVYGETNPKKVFAVGTLLIEIGDVMYFETLLARPASALADGGTLAANQEAIHDAFLGVSLQQRLASQTDSTELVVATTGVFEFPLRTALGAQKEVGTLFGIDEDAAGTAVLRASLIEVATENLALGRLVERALNGALKVRIEIVSTKHLGGPQAMA